MVSGRDTLKRMDKTLKKARRDLKRIDTWLEATSRATTQNKLAQARAIDRMARIRLDAAMRGEIVEHLEAATREAKEIIAARDEAIASIGERIDSASTSVEALEERRDTLHDDVDTAARTLSEREAAVQRYLETDEAFQLQLERTREADAIAVSALEKAELADEDRRRKGEPFEGDELFMYLWQRGYGTSEYKANPLTRLLDGWVAKRCRFQQARPNYWMLLQIPKRLAEHADHAREAADAELDKLQDIEELAASDGDVPEARADLEALERRQDGVDAEIEAAEQSLAELQSEQQRFSAGEDDYLVNALRVFSATMERRDVNNLTRLARATMTPEDDAIVDELKTLRQEFNELEDELREHRDRQRDRLKHVRELEKVRRDFKRSRYDDLHSRFDKEDIIERMIGEVVAGVIQGSALWNTLRRYQRYIDAAGEWPDFGSGGITRPGSRPRGRPGGRRKSKPRSRPPSWHWPGPSSSRGGGFKMPKSRSRSRGRGGFRTGGGF